MVSWKEGELTVRKMDLSSFNGVPTPSWFEKKLFKISFENFFSSGTS
jgi:hypothetical protein